MLRVKNFSSSEKAALAVAERGAGGRRQRRPAEFHPEADDEMRAAARYYEERQLGLGDEFLNEVERSVTFAAERPEAGTPLEEDLRWVLTRRFRYAVIYREFERGIEVLAVAHLRRRPGYWRSRV